MMDKLLIYSGYDQAGPHIFPIEVGSSNSHVKLATEVHPLIARYMSDARKIPGKTQLLIDAMGSGEWWGANRNGDYFPQDQLSHEGEDYGYRTFMRLAYPYKHHVNKDPAKAYGDRVILSVYHPTMHRVQLIVAVHNDRCSDIIQQVDNGDYPDVSMGCRVPYDQCSICGNKAPKRSYYCDHLKYQMNRILSDGRRVMAINFKPKLFDISFVLVRAEKASSVLAKVASAQPTILTKSSAELGEIYYGKRQLWKGADLKKAEVSKSGEIGKRVPLKIEHIEPVIESAPSVKELEPPLPSPVVNAMTGFSLDEIMSTLSFLGIDPKPEEFQKIILIKAGQQKLAEQWEREGKVFDENSGEIPANASSYFQVTPEKINEKVAYLLRPHLPHRSCYTPHLVPRLEKYASDESQWYPSTKSTALGAVPIAATVAGLYKYLKSKATPESMTKFERAVHRHPWLLGLLFAGGVGAASAAPSLMRPLSLNPSTELDGKFASSYTAHDKTASKKILIPLAMAPMAYMYSGVQRSRAMHGERLGKFDRFVATRPDVAAIASMLAAPVAMRGGGRLGQSFKQMMKSGNLHSDFGLFALTSGAKLLPAAVMGAMVDATVIKNISKIVDKRRKNGNPR